MSKSFHIPLVTPRAIELAAQIIVAVRKHPQDFAVGLPGEWDEDDGYLELHCVILRMTQLGYGMDEAQYAHNRAWLLLAACSKGLVPGEPKDINNRRASPAAYAAAATAACLSPEGFDLEELAEIRDLTAEGFPVHGVYAGALS